MRRSARATVSRSSSSSPRADESDLDVQHDFGGAPFLSLLVAHIEPVDALGEVLEQGLDPDFANGRGAFSIRLHLTEHQGNGVDLLAVDCVDDEFCGQLTLNAQVDAKH